MASEPDEKGRVVSPELADLLETVHYSTEGGLDAVEGWNSEEVAHDPDDEEISEPPASLSLSDKVRQRVREQVKRRFPRAGH